MPVPAGLLNVQPDLKPEVNMHLAGKADWALVDKSIPCLQDQGSTQFWRELMQRKSG